MKTALRAELDDTQLKELADYACRREEELRSHDMQNWRKKLDIYQRCWENDLNWRRTVAAGDGALDDGNIYNKCNETMGLVRAAISFVTARTEDDLFGTAPWFTSIPEGPAGLDDALATMIQEHAQWKLRQSRFEDAARDSIGRAFNLGCFITKNTWRRDVQKFKSYKLVLVDPAVKGKGRAVLTETGDYIYSDDETCQREVLPDGTLGRVLPDGDDQQEGTEGTEQEPMEQMPPAAPDETEQPGDPDAVGEAQETAPPSNVATSPSDSFSASPSLQVSPSQPQQAQTVTVFVKDPDVVMADSYDFEEWLIEDEVVNYEGLDCATIDYKSWRCRMDVARIEDSDFRGHVYDARLSDLKARVAQPMDKETTELFERLLKGGDASAKTEEARAKQQGTGSASGFGNGAPGQAGIGGRGDDKNPRYACMDFECEWDPNGEGDVKTIYGTVLLMERELIFCDYLANVTPKGDSIFAAGNIFPLPGFWFGRGWWELYEQFNDALDKHFNLAMYRNHLTANPVFGTHDDAIEEDLEDSFAITSGFRVKLKAGKTLEDFIQVLQLPKGDPETWQIIEFMVNLFQLETGVTSAAQGSVGDLPATNTATGIQSVLSSGSTLQKKPAQDIRKGIQTALERAIRLLYEMQNRAETFSFGEGTNKQLATLTPEQVRGLEMNVQILMTRFKQREDVENAMACLSVHQQYLALPEQEKASARTLYLQILKGHGIQHADQIIRPPLPPPPSPPVQDPVEHVSVNYKDLEPEDKVDLLQRIGLHQSGKPIPSGSEEDAGAGVQAPKLLKSA